VRARARTHIHAHIIHAHIIHAQDYSKISQKKSKHHFTRADKENCSNGWGRIHTNKMEDLLQDMNTYIPVKKNPIKIIEKNLNSTIKRWWKNEHITKQTYLSLFSSNSNLPITYGLPKIHKENIPLRILGKHGLVSRSKIFIHKLLMDSLTFDKSHCEQ